MALSPTDRTEDHKGPRLVAATKIAGDLTQPEKPKKPTREKAFS
jgi:hypothetical protein